MLWPWSKRSVLTINEHVWVWSLPQGQKTELDAVKSGNAFSLGPSNRRVAIRRLAKLFPQVQFHVDAWPGKDAASTSAFKIVSFVRSSSFPSEADLLARLNGARATLIQESFEASGGL